MIEGMHASAPGGETESLRRRVAELEARLRAREETAPEKEILLGEAERIACMGSWSLKLDTGEVEWSDGLFRIFGLDPSVDRATTDNYFRAVHPEDLESSLEGLSLLQKKGVLEPREVRVVWRDGSVRTLMSRGQVVKWGDDGRPLVAVGAMLDATEQVRVERELRRMAGLLREAQGLAKVGTWVWQPETGHLEWSEELYRIFGVDTAVKPDAALFFSFLNPEDMSKHIGERRRALDSGEGGPFELRIRRRDGELRHIMVQAKRLDGDSRFLGTCWDITERKQLEEQLRQSHKLEAVGRLAAGVAHDFNNLLSVIAGNAELLIAERPDERLRRIRDTADVGAALTRRLLALSRQSLVRPAALDLDEAVREVTRLLERILGEHVEIALDLRAEPSVVMADISQIQQVILNLSINARDAMPMGGLLTLATTRAEAPPAGAWGGTGDEVHPGPWICLSVKDTGTGMEAAVLERAFEPFFTTKEDKGTGLGLSTVLDLVNQSGGRVSVRSEPGRGTEVMVCLPAHAGRPARRRQSLEEAPGGTESVLVVEDHPGLRDLIKAFLEDGGYRVRAVGRPGEAEAIWEREGDGFDLLLTDLVMPEKSGRQLAQAFAAHRPSLKVLYISGYDSGSGPGKTVEGPFLQKPFTRGGLLTAVRGALEGKSIGKKGPIS